jgi:uncharacterized membrane protein
MMKSLQRILVAFSLAAMFSLPMTSAFGQSPSSASKPQTPQSKPPQKKNQAGPPVLPAQPRHYPILLIAQGTDPVWNLRLGMKGPERLERAGYPPTPLEPGAVEQETTGSSWTYHAKDAQTQATIAVHLSREVCTDGVSETKYTFRIAVDHAQIGTLKGCAKIVPDQFPEFKQKNLDDDDPEKLKPAPPTIPNFKPPVAVAYLDSSGRVMLAQNDVPKLVAPKGYQLSLSHNGKHLLFTRDDASPTAKADRSIVLYDSTTGKTTELFQGLVQQAFWSPDDTKIAFLKFADNHWRVWTAPISAPDSATQLFAGEVLAIEGWQDQHTVIAVDASNLYFIGEDGQPSKSILLIKIYGELYSFSSSDAIRVHPLNPDLLMVSAVSTKPIPGIPPDLRTGTTSAFFFYEIKSGREFTATAPALGANAAEWSRDGLQIFFNGWDSARKPMIYRQFWDGTGPKKIRPGTDLVIGQ